MTCHTDSRRSVRPKGRIGEFSTNAAYRQHGKWYSPCLLLISVNLLFISPLLWVRRSHSRDQPVDQWPPKCLSAKNVRKLRTTYSVTSAITRISGAETIVANELAARLPWHCFERLADRMDVQSLRNRTAGSSLIAGYFVELCRKLRRLTRRALVDDGSRKR